MDRPIVGAASRAAPVRHFEVRLGSADLQHFGPHRIARIRREIQQDLFELGPIGFDGPRIRTVNGAQLDVRLSEPAEEAVAVSIDFFASEGV